MQRRSTPSPALADWIAHFWGWQMTAGTPLPTLFPGTGGELLLNLGDPLRIVTIPLDSQQPPNCLILPKGEAVLLRPRKSRMTFAPQGEIDLLSIRLRSATCFPLLGIAMDELDDVPVSFTDLGLCCAIPELINLPYEMRISRLERWLLAIVDRCHLMNTDLIQAVNRLYYGDSFSTIRSQLGMSERTILRRVHQFTGVDVRYFCRTARFQRTLRQLLAEGDVLNSALNHGYCDQAHFIKTCRLYTDLTPTELLKRQYRQLNYYTNTLVGCVP
ncbi:TPA: helix-turn-helix domain-containing protein [Citrobacter farmeri]